MPAFFTVASTSLTLKLSLPALIISKNSTTTELEHHKPQTRWYINVLKKKNGGSEGLFRMTISI